MSHSWVSDCTRKWHRQNNIRKLWICLKLIYIFHTSHNLPAEPTSDTLSLYIVYMSHYINPCSVTTYLAGITQQLEPYFSSVRDARNSTLIHRTLRGCLREHSTPTIQKRALSTHDLKRVTNHYKDSTSHDDKLFVAMLLSGFFGLLHLGKLSFSDDPSLHNWKKVIRHYTIKMSDAQYKFSLPGHKADCFFEENCIIISAKHYQQQPLYHFCHYLTSHDQLHPVSSPLWLTKKQSHPNPIFLHQSPQTFLWQHHQWTINESRQCYRTCWTWHTTPHHSSLQTMVFHHLLNIHSQKPYFTSRLLIFQHS